LYLWREHRGIATLKQPSASASKDGGLSGECIPRSRRDGSTDFFTRTANKSEVIEYDAAEGGGANFVPIVEDDVVQ